jgi:hypothetical protein
LNGNQVRLATFGGAVFGEMPFQCKILVGVPSILESGAGITK